MLLPFAAAQVDVLVLYMKWLGLCWGETGSCLEIGVACGTDAGAGAGVGTGVDTGRGGGAGAGAIVGAYP
jgi:hypothetical protein